MTSSLDILSNLVLVMVVKSTAKEETKPAAVKPQQISSHIKTLSAAAGVILYGQVKASQLTWCSPFHILSDTPTAND